MCASTMLCTLSHWHAQPPEWALLAECRWLIRNVSPAQASCRRTLFTRKGAAEQNVPTSNEESMSILRQVLPHRPARSIIYHGHAVTILK